MLRVLFRKQLSELYAKYSTNKKNGKRMSGIGFIILMSIIGIAVASAFYGLCVFFVHVLIPLGLTWLFFTMLSIISLFAGVFGNAFTTFSTLFKARDNELLLSMPIKPGAIILSRLMSVYFIGAIYVILAYLPGQICYFVMQGFNLGILISSILNYIGITLITLVLSCIIGYIVALATSKIKSKAPATVILSIGLLLIYYVVYFKMNSLLSAFESNVGIISEKFSGRFNPLYLIGAGAAGDYISLGIYIGVVVLAALFCYLIISKTFIRIVTKNTGSDTNKKKTVKAKQNSIDKALLSKELSRFKSCSAYMLNSGLGVIILIGLAVLLIVKTGDVHNIVDAFSGEFSLSYDFIMSFVYVAITIPVGLIISMDSVVTPSVSLEGKYLWILKTLPVDSWKILKAKMKLHLLINGFPAIIFLVTAIIVFKVDLLSAISILVFGLVFLLYTAAYGMKLGLRKPYFEWITEVQPIKQSTSVLFYILIGWGTIILVGALYVLIKLVIGIEFVNAALYLLFCSLLLGVITYFIINNLKTWGAKRFENL